MPLMRPTLKMPPASQAPVEPADTAAWASPFFSCIMAPPWRRPSCGRMAMVGLSWVGNAVRGLHDRQPVRVVGLLLEQGGQGLRRTAKANGQILAGGQGLQTAVHNGGRGVIAAHGVYSDDAHLFNNLRSRPPAAAQSGAAVYVPSILAKTVPSGKGFANGRSLEAGRKGKRGTPAAAKRRAKVLGSYDRLATAVVGIDGVGQKNARENGGGCTGRPSRRRKRPGPRERRT